MNENLVNACLFADDFTAFGPSDLLDLREESRVKVTGMLVVSLRSVNCRFWSHLGFGTERHYTYSLRYHSGLCIKKCTINALTSVLV